MKYPGYIRSNIGAVVLHQSKHFILASKTWSSHRAVGPMGRRLGQASPHSAWSIGKYSWQRTTCSEQPILIITCQLLAAGCMLGRNPLLYALCQEGYEGRSLFRTWYKRQRAVRLVPTASKIRATTSTVS